MNNYHMSEQELEELKKICGCIEQFADLNSDEITYLAKKLKVTPEIQIGTEQSMRERISSLFYTNLTLFAHPDGLITQIVADSRTNAEAKPIIDSLMKRVSEKYLKLINEYRETLETSK